MSSSRLAAELGSRRIVHRAFVLISYVFYYLVLQNKDQFSLLQPQRIYLNVPALLVLDTAVCFCHCAAFITGSIMVLLACVSISLLARDDVSYK